jgi:hypothetical protein
MRLHVLAISAGNMFNFDRAQSPASIDRIKKIAANAKATVIIQPDARDIDKLSPRQRSNGRGCEIPPSPPRAKARGGRGVLP